MRLILCLAFPLTFLITCKQLFQLLWQIVGEFNGCREILANLNKTRVKISPTTNHWYWSFLEKNKLFLAVRPASIATIHKKI